jgi:hypothetical protein
VKWGLSVLARYRRANLLVVAAGALVALGPLAVILSDDHPHPVAVVVTALGCVLFVVALLAMALGALAEADAEGAARVRDLLALGRVGTVDPMRIGVWPVAHPEHAARYLNRTPADQELDRAISDAFAPVEDELVKMGVDFTRGEIWKPYTIVDRNLYTGQNPASAAPLAQQILDALK